MTLPSIRSPTVPVRWGVIGPGRIVTGVMNDLAHLSGGVLHAVGSGRWTAPRPSPGVRRAGGSDRRRRAPGGPGGSRGGGVCDGGDVDPRPTRRRPTA